MQPSVAFSFFSLYFLCFHSFTVCSASSSLLVLVEQQNVAALRSQELNSLTLDKSQHKFLCSLIFLCLLLLFVKRFLFLSTCPFLSLSLCLFSSSPGRANERHRWFCSGSFKPVFIAGPCSRGLPVSVMRIWGLSWLTCILSLLAQSSFHL